MNIGSGSNRPPWLNNSTDARLGWATMRTHATDKKAYAGQFLNTDFPAALIAARIAGVGLMVLVCDLPNFLNAELVGAGTPAFSVCECFYCALIRSTGMTRSAGRIGRDFGGFLRCRRSLVAGFGPLQ